MNDRSYFSAQPGASSGTEPRSPSYRRPPASRSSHGIETHSGPPPALSTQRSYNADPPWRNTHSSDSPTTTPQPLPQSQKADDSIASILQTSHSSVHDRRNSEPSQFANGTRPFSSDSRVPAVSMAHQNGMQALEEDEDPTLRLNGQQNALGRHSLHGRDVWPKEVSQEDLFLNLVRENSVLDDASEVMSRGERRRVSDQSPMLALLVQNNGSIPLSKQC